MHGCGTQFGTFVGTLADDRTVLYKTKSLDGTKPNSNIKINLNPKTNPI